MFYLAELNKHILLNENSKRWEVENSLLNIVQSF